MTRTLLAEGSRDCPVCGETKDRLSRHWSYCEFPNADGDLRSHLETFDSTEPLEIDRIGGTCLNVDREGETSVMINVDDSDHAQDFAVVGQDEGRLRQYIKDGYYGE